MSKNFIPYGRQDISETDIAAVVNVLKSDYLTQGPLIDQFEKDLAKYTGSKYCIVVSNGTAALHLAVASLNVAKDSTGITTANTFVASSNCLIYNNINPLLADIELNTFNMDVSSLKKNIRKDTKIIIPVHFAGYPVEMKAIAEIAANNNAFIIEDASHAIGGEYTNGKKIGSCCYSDMTVFSFHPVKTITTGEGGAITTNNKELYEKLLMLRTHGITKDQSKFLESAHGDWYYEMQTLGFNYRMTELQAALGIEQLKRLDQIVIRRLEIVKKYNEAFHELSWLKTPDIKVNKVGQHLYPLLINFEEIGKSRTDVMHILKKEGIGTQVHYIPIYKHPFYQRNFHFSDSDFPNSEYYYSKTLSIPLFPSMTDREVEHVIKNIQKLK